MAEIGSRRGAANTSVILAVVAVAAIVGLIYWLEVTAVPTQTSVVVEDAEDEAMQLDVPIVGLSQIRGEADAYASLEVAIRNQTISSRLGEEAVWVGPDDNPFLIKLVGGAVSRGQEMEIGDPVNLRGTLYPMTDSVLDAWSESGAIANEGDRAVASFAEYFFEATEIERGVGGDSSDGDGQ